MEKKNKNTAIVLGIVAGIFLILIVSSVYWYKKQLADGNLIKKPDPLKTGTGTGANATAGSGTGTGVAAVSRQAITIPAGSRIVPGTQISTPNGNVVDLYSYTSSSN